MADNPLKPIENLDPTLCKLVMDTRTLVLGDGGVLPKKYKYLIAMALDAAAHSPAGVRSLSRAAMQFGATKEEVGEALRVAQFIAGCGAVYVAADGLRELT
jgi:alkylhydroperoxidase/carboxymuconolactone decarboxylase family protein YurZ